MTLFIIGFIIGTAFGAYLGNKTLRAKVNKDARKLYVRLIKYANKVGDNQ